MIDFQGYGPQLLDGALLTIELAVASLALSVGLGLVLASGKLSRSRLLRRLASGYSLLIRGVPPLVLMMLFFYGGQVALNSLVFAINGWLGTDWLFLLQPLVAGIITLGLIYAAYMSETFRGAFLAVDAGQIEAARAYGMSEWLVFRRVRFPLMMRHALPGLNNNWMVLLKATALVSIIGLSDMVYIGNQAAKDTHQPFLFLIPVAVIYLLMTSVSEVTVAWLQRRYETGFRGGR